MDQKTLALLNPTAETASAIEAAINIAAKARHDAEHRGVVAKAELAAEVLTLTSKGRRDLHDAIDDAAADVLQIDGILGTLEWRLSEASRIESCHAAKAAHASLTARITAHEALFLETYIKHRDAITALLGERQALTDEAMAHNSLARRFGEFQVNGIEEMLRARRETWFFKSAEELASDKALEEAEQQRAYWKRREAVEARNRLALEQFSNRPTPVPIVSQPSGVNMVTQG